MTDKKALRRWRGQVPTDGVIVEGCRANGVCWALFMRGKVRNSHGSWVGLKVAADRALGRANYWLSWDTRRGALVALPDARALKAQQPEVYRWVADCMAHYAGAVPSDSLVLVSDLQTGASGFITRDSLPARPVIVAQLNLAQPLLGDEPEPIITKSEPLIPYAHPLLGNGPEASVASENERPAPYICKGLGAISDGGLRDDSDDCSDLI